MRFTMQANTGIPVGNYSAEFIGAEEFNNESDYGPAVRLKFRVLDGPQVNSEVSRICSQTLSPKSNLYKFVRMLKGSDIEAGEEVDLQSYVGTRGMIVVEETDSGGTRVGSFLRQL